jgi:hypothetical protein
MLELLNGSAKQGHGFRLISRVVVHLATTGLPGWKVYGMAQPFQYPYDGFARVREECVVIASDEKRDTQRPSSGIFRVYPTSDTMVRD